MGAVAVRRLTSGSTTRINADRSALASVGQMADRKGRDVLISLH